MNNVTIKLSNASVGWASILGTIEEDFALSALCDHLGHVMLHLSFINNDGSNVWQSKVDIG